MSIPGLTAATPRGSTTSMIYCVIPRELEDEMLERMTEYYRDNPEVEVILDRRDGAANDRRRGETAMTDNRRVTRDRRRPRAAGTFPRVDGPA
jgi:hypothetical protein